MNKFDDIQLALAGVCQSAALVRGLAKHGNVDEKAYEASIGSIINTSPNSVTEVYGELGNVELGLKTLLSQMAGNNQTKDSEVTRYVANILSLERKLSRSPKTIEDIASRIENVKRQSQHYSLFEPQVIGNLASVYKELISPLTQKIQVAGDPALLKQVSIQDKVRALLLAGIRSAFLWRQLGGKRRNIILQRNKICRSAQQTLIAANQQEPN